MARVLIAGCGYVGTGLAQRLLGQGHEVIGLRRDPSQLRPDIETVRADLTCREELNDLPGPFDFVFFTAASDAWTPEAYHLTYIRALGNLIDAMARTGRPPRRIFYTSSTAVYAQHHGEWVNERSPTMPESFAGTILLESEAIARSAPFPCTVIRFSGIYGPERASLLDRVRKGKIRVGPHQAYTNRIHRDDCAAVLTHLMALDDPAGLYLATDDEPVEWRVVVEWLAETLGAPPPPFNPDASPPHTNKRCSNDQLHRTGYNFIYPTFRDGYLAMRTAHRKEENP